MCMIRVRASERMKKETTELVQYTKHRYEQLNNHI